MTKQTKAYVLVGAAILGGYLLWQHNQSKPKSFANYAAPTCKEKCMVEAVRCWQNGGGQACYGTPYTGCKLGCDAGSA